MTKLRVLYGSNQEGLFFALHPEDRVFHPRGRKRVALFFSVEDWPPTIGKLLDGQPAIIGSLLTSLPEGSIEVELIQEF